MRLTNRNGQLDAAIPISVPNRNASLTPDTGVTPYTTIRLYAKRTDYEEIDVDGVQVFPGTVTEQNLEMIPLSELPKSWNKAEQFQTFTQSKDHMVRQNPDLLPPTRDDLWKNFEYFAKAVLPEAERAGVKLITHPSDPPISPLAGVARIFISLDDSITNLIAIFVFSFIFFTKFIQLFTN